MDYGLIGAKLGHSFSKPVHESLGSYTYHLYPLPTRSDLDAFLRNRAFKAVNVTIPYKEDVIPYCAQVDARAAAIGAVNTLLNRDGALYGYNTDYAGFAFLAAQAGVTFANRHVLVLGTGGTQKTVCAVARDAGAASITLVSRAGSGETAARSAAQVCATTQAASPQAASHATPQYSASAECCESSRNASRVTSGAPQAPDNALAPPYPVVNYEQAIALTGTNVIVNTTPCGMYPATDAQPISLAPFRALTGVLDVVYNPLRTQLVQAAQARGIPAAGGLVMLVAQAKYASELFTGKQIAEVEITRVWRELLCERTNLVLIGMPGSGKTQVGKHVAALLGRPFVDMDAEIVTRAGKSVADIFDMGGEQAFRDWESAVCADFARKTGQVIATGGGAILRVENVQALRQNGALIYLDRPLEALQAGNGRPLSPDAAAVAKLYQARAPLYRAAANRIVPNTGTPEQAALAAKEALYEIAHSEWA